MGTVIQFVLSLAGIVIAVILLVALVQLFAIRKSLKTLVQQTQMLVRQRRYEEAPEQSRPADRPATVDTPVQQTEMPIQQTRSEAAPEQSRPVDRPATVDTPVQQTLMPIQQTLSEIAPDQSIPTGEPSDQAVPTDRPATVNLGPPAPTQSKVSHLSTVIGVIVLVFAVAFLIFMIVYTK